MPKRQSKEIKIKTTARISKVIHDNLTRHCIEKNKVMNDVIEEALTDFFYPYDKENHDRDSKRQLSIMINMLHAIINRLDISLIFNEEYIKTFYRNIPELVLEDSHARIAVNTRIQEGHEHFMKRVIDSAMNDTPNILTTFNITKYETE